MQVDLREEGSVPLKADLVRCVTNAGRGATKHARMHPCGSRSCHHDVDRRYQRNRCQHAEDQP